MFKNISWILWIMPITIVPVFCDQFQDHADNSCNIHNGTGRCITVKDCHVAMLVLSIPKLDPTHTNALRILTCGFEGKQPKVCCPDSNKLEIPPGCTSQHRKILERQQKSSRNTNTHNISEAYSKETKRNENDTQIDTVINCIVYESRSSGIMTQESKTAHSSTAAPDNFVESLVYPPAIPAAGFAAPLQPIPTTVPRYMLNKTLIKYTGRANARIGQSVASLNEEKLKLLPNKTICGRSMVSDRILGGTLAGIDELPWLARIIYWKDDHRLFGCGGTLINSRYVITAAHCVKVPFPIIAVRLGEWDEETIKDCHADLCNNPPVDYNIDEITMVDAEDIQSLRIPENDLALLRLDKRVEFTEFIKPACLPISSHVASQDYSPDIVYTAAGWGKTEHGTSSTILRKVNLKAVDVNICEAIYPSVVKNIKELIICAGGRKGEDTCTGDSGGPLLKPILEEYKTTWFIYGVTSYGSARCGAEGKPGIYTRLVPYMHWIIQNMYP